MYLPTATSYAASPVATVSLNEPSLDDDRFQWRLVAALFLRYLQICIGWLGHHIYHILAVLFRVLKIADLLNFVKLAAFQILTWCGIALAVVVGLPIAVQIAYIAAQFAYLSLCKLWHIHAQKRQAQRELRWCNEQRERRAAEARVFRAARDAEVEAMAQERLRQTREFQALQDRLKHAEKQRQKVALAEYQQWEKKCGRVLENKKTMSEFPFPPLARCTELGCPHLGKWSAPPCKHNVKRFLQGSGKFSLQLLKEQRHTWHADRFESCREDLKEEFQRLATSLFVVLDPMYKDLNTRQAGS